MSYWLGTVSGKKIDLAAGSDEHDQHQAALCCLRRWPDARKLDAAARPINRRIQAGQHKHSRKV